MTSIGSQGSLERTPGALFRAMGQFMILSMSTKNCARRVLFLYFSNPVSVCCFMASLMSAICNLESWKRNG
jgi:hypothetical protein